MTVGVAMVALTEGRPQRIQANNQQLFQAAISPRQDHQSSGTVQGSRDIT